MLLLFHPVNEKALGHKLDAILEMFNMAAVRVQLLSSKAVTLYSIAVVPVRSCSGS